LIRWAGPAGAALAALSYAASFRPSIYANSSFWTTAPTFFLLRVGILVAGLALAYVWAERLSREGWSPMEEFGRSSLFVYWVHVELVYGIPTAWLRRQLSLEQAALAYAIFTLLMFALVLVKDRIVRAVWPQRALSPLSHR
jgi:fucose 4-O-acetylase-like acetyltransferase